MRKFLKIGSVSLAALAGATVAASAAEGISGDVGYNINSHFVSYGVDVWGAGSAVYGSASTSSIYGDLSVKLTDNLSWNNNVWTDINDNVTSRIGGSLQEIDVNTGLSYNFGGGFSGSVTYGAWTYGGDVEEVIDTSLGFDDTGLLFDDFAFNPKITWHYRVSGNNGQSIGSAVVVGVSPSFPLFYNLSLTVPAGLVFFTTDNFQGGWEGGVGYGYFGGSLGAPLAFIPEKYGAWSANFDLIAYFTKEAAIPSNPASNFLTASFNIKMAF